MPRLKRCPVCKSERYNAYIRTGKVYTKVGNKSMEASKYRICPTCDTIFDQNDVVYYQAIHKIRDGILLEMNNYFNIKKLEEVDTDTDPKILKIISTITTEVMEAITQHFNATINQAAG